jgi:hypothetical protein
LKKSPKTHKFTIFMPHFPRNNSFGQVRPEPFFESLLVV